MVVMHSNRHLCNPLINVVHDTDMKYLAIFVDHKIYLFVTSFVELQITLLLLQHIFCNVLICF